MTVSLTVAVPLHDGLKDLGLGDVLGPWSLPH